MHGRLHSEKQSGLPPSVEPGHALCRDTGLTVHDGSASCFLSCSTHWRNWCRWTRWNCGVLGRPCGPGWSPGSNPKYRDSFAAVSQPLRRCSVDFCLCYPESLATNPRRENRGESFTHPAKSRDSFRPPRFSVIPSQPIAYCCHQYLALPYSSNGTARKARLTLPLEW